MEPVTALALLSAYAFYRAKSSDETPIDVDIDPAVIVGEGNEDDPVSELEGTQLTWPVRVTNEPGRGGSRITQGFRFPEHKGVDICVGGVSICTAGVART